MRTHETPVPQIMQLKLFMGRVFLSEDEQKRIEPLHRVRSIQRL